MVFEEVLKGLNHELKADKNHAQILVEIFPSSRTFEEAKTIIEASGAHIVDLKHLKSNWVLVELDILDMREIVLRLTENGFSNIKGLNALSFLVK